jgi:TPR repeat protein
MNMGSQGRYLAVVLAVSLTACTKDEAPKGSQRGQLLAKVGADPKSVKTRVVARPGGGNVRVTTFRRKPHSPAVLAALTADCQRGELARCAALGRAQQAAGDDAKAEQTWRSACKANHGRACHELGNMLSSPYRKLRRDKEALAFLKKACALKVEASCYFLGTFQETGKLGFTADEKAAAAYYEKGCRYGHYWACKKVGKTPPR